MDLFTTPELIRKRECSPVELVKKTLAKIAEENPKNNAFITVSEAESIRVAIKLEQEIINGNYRGLLHGIPIALKDLIFTKNLRTTMVGLSVKEACLTWPTRLITSVQLPLQL